MSSVLGVKNGFERAAIQDKIKGCQTKAMKRLIRLKRRGDFRRMLHEDGEGGKDDLEK